MYPMKFKESEKKLLHKIADFLFKVPQINEIHYLSDGFQNTGHVGFFYNTNFQAGKQYGLNTADYVPPKRTYYKAVFTGTGLNIESEQTTEIPDELKHYIESRFQKTRYLHEDNWHHWSGVYLTELLVKNN